MVQEVDVEHSSLCQKQSIFPLKKVGFFFMVTYYIVKENMDHWPFKGLVLLLCHDVVEEDL